MIIPDIKSFRGCLRRGNLVAVTESIPADLETPVSCFLKVAEKRPNCFLFESAEQEERVGRYSILGVDPVEILFTDDRKQSFELKGGRKRPVRVSGHLIDEIAGRMDRYRLANPEIVPGFSGGFVGFLGYENVEDFEDVRLNPLKGPSFPRAVFFLCHEFLVFDHFLKRLHLVVLSHAAGAREADGAYKRAVRRIRLYKEMLRTPLKLSAGRRTGKKAGMRAVSNMTPRQYEEKVRKIKEYIRAGDCIQVVLSQRFKLPHSDDDFRIYRALRSINPSPYMFYFRFGSLRLIGSSPELLVKKTGSQAEVRPIAGTRPRGKTAPEDQRLEENLKKSPKEVAEHLMLVDLGRNDLGRVCRYDSIRVPNFARVERYSHVMHLVSDVTGSLKPGKNAFDLLKATFPAGTLSGAPKIRAMEIINELEPEKRGPYAGCVGYFSHNKDMDMCITIRTLVADGKNLYLQAGAGIVKDSSPRKEYQETVNKAGALIKALEEQDQFDAVNDR